MRADSRHLSFVQDDDLIRMAYRADTLSYDQNSGLFCLFSKSLPQSGVRFEVQRREAVVEDVQLRLLYESSGDGKTLLLTA